MGTRSTIGFYKGNEVRYIFVASDGFNHGATLEKIGHDACELLWDQIGEAEARGEKVWLDHLFDDEYDMSGHEYEHTSRRTPIPAKDDWDDKYMKRFGHELSGVIRVDTGWGLRVGPRSMLELINMNGNTWLYDLENDNIFFMGDDNFNPNQLETAHPITDSYQWNHTYIKF